jgi:gliding motility associated protien GldN
MTNLLSIRAVRRMACLAVLVLGAQFVRAQETETLPPAIEPPIDDITSREIVADRSVLKYQPVREADIFWEKRLWRIIDTREKMNLPFVAPESPLFGIFVDAAMKGELRVYSTEDDHFTKALSIKDIQEKIVKRDTILILDTENGDEQIKIVENEINWENVKRYRLKESWYFDSRTGALKVRILGIAPLINVLDDEGNFKFEQPLFWVYYPGARELLARHKVVNPAGNYASTLSWEDWFEMRYFSSMITKENNTLDLRLEDSYTGLDLVNKAKAIEQTMFNTEHDLWQY